jgi:tRNA-specific 2-thiouridylase
MPAACLTEQMEVAIAMSGGVDSSVAAALLVDAGHQVTGVTLRLWGGVSDSGCCSASDVDDARRVAQQLGIAHHVFNLTEEFQAAVVQPYIDGHANGKTPNPCVECNRTVKFELLLERCRRLGFDKLATGHHARIVDRNGVPKLARGVDDLKDQSYVLSMLPASTIADLVLPVGEMNKSEVRERALAIGLRTATKPDSQDVCFIRSDEGREGFLGERLNVRPGTVIDRSTGKEMGSVPAVQLVTIGQRRGIGAGPNGERRYVVGVDFKRDVIEVDSLEHALQRRLKVLSSSVTTTGEALALGEPHIVQVSAHGKPLAAVLEATDDGFDVMLDVPARLVAPGQTLAFYDVNDPDIVLGSAIVA